MSRQYNDPAGGDQSSIGNEQFNEFYYQAKALREAQRAQVFLPLASVTGMPKHMGKKIKRYHYLPLLNDENLNDQGLDATGIALDKTKVGITFPQAIMSFAVEGDATAAEAAINAVEAVATKAGAGPWTVTVTKLLLINKTGAQGTAVIAAVPGARVAMNGGNLYGSSKDVGLIPKKFPALTENGGRVNRVGFKRKEIEGTIEKFGIFDEYTQESMDFDTDSELMMHINREMLTGASDLSEAMVQTDLLNSAGLIKYSGAATSRETVGTTVVTYRDLLQLAIDLDNNLTPKQTTMFKGIRLEDTVTIPSARVMYIGSELQVTMEEMVDLHGDRAFIPVQKYAAGGNTLTGEIGTIGYFRLVVVPEMFNWSGVGAVGDATFHRTDNKLDVFPMLVVGKDSFTTIGFQTDGKTVKFTIYHKKPGKEMVSSDDPFGEKGLMSIKWYYGFMALRNERIALQLTAAKL